MGRGSIRPIVIGLFISKGRLLVFEGFDPGRNECFYRPIGGGIEFGEVSHETLRREMKEELNAEITNVSFLGVMEDVFTFNNEIGHQIVFVYSAEFVDQTFYERDTVNSIENGVPVQLYWKPIRDFENGSLRLVPDQLMDLIKKTVFN